MAADKDGDKPLQREIAAWMRNLREEWFAKLKCPQVPLKARHRFVYAFFGSMTWVIATVLGYRAFGTDLANGHGAK